MSKLSDFFKKLFFEIREEIVMDEPQVKPKNKNRKKRQLLNTKHFQVKKHLTEKGFIDSWTAINLYGATRLSAIIFNLRKEGYEIDSLDNSAYDRNNELCNFTTYKYINNNGVN